MLENVCIEIELDRLKEVILKKKKAPYLSILSSIIFRVKYPALWWGWTSKLAQVLNLTTLSSSVKGAKATPI